MMISLKRVVVVVCVTLVMMVLYSCSESASAKDQMEQVDEEQSDKKEEEVDENEDDGQEESVSEKVDPIIIEAETVTPSDDRWKLKTELLGFSGSGYLVWEGPELFWKGTDNIGKIGAVTYDVAVKKEGTYKVILRTYIAKENPEKPNTEHNDTWLKVVADDFYAIRDASKIYPKGTGKQPNPKGENGNGFFKAYMNHNGAWTEVIGTSDHEFHTIYASFDTPGVYKVTIAPRSNYHALDYIKFVYQ
ncbi:hypothetical protein [Ochrovirga pacifica]|uniref:hypothetical protein n=1 Tax=Ochrovirga pacifica TaxID=1042376 RepID=UPI000495DBAF|nr:hypothetical protein [Ochrovirga pacifica]